MDTDAADTLTVAEAMLADAGPMRVEHGRPTAAPIEVE
jgi:hypothetical protein